MESQKAAQSAADATMDEFQLTELESRLEMTVALTPGETVESLVSCCDCWWYEDYEACGGR